MIKVKDKNILEKVNVKFIKIKHKKKEYIIILRKYIMDMIKKNIKTFFFRIKYRFLRNTL